MSWRRIVGRWRAMLRGRRLDAELNEEIRAHLEIAEAENLAAGMSPEAARAAARRAFGSVAMAQERTRAAWSVRWLEVLSQDVRYALRTLRKAPGFTAVTVLTLALGIGANTAIFTLLDQILLRRLPVPDAQQLVLLSTVGMHYGDNTGSHVLSHPMYRDFRDQNQVFSGMFSRHATRVNLIADGRAERVAAELVSGTYFPVLRVRAALGRTIVPEDDRATAPARVVVLAHDFWMTRFGADPAIVGGTVEINQRRLTVIGVAAPGFRGVQLGHDAKLFVPVALQPVLGTMRSDSLLEDRRTRWLNSFGRLRPGVSLDQARASLQPIMKAMLQMEVRQPAFSRANEETRRGFLNSSMNVLPGAQGLPNRRQQLSTPLWVLMGAAGFVLLIACANLSNLVMARSTTRRRELAVRLALGAGRLRVVAQLLTETVVLSLLGGLFALALAFGAARALLVLYLRDTASMPLSTAPDLRILAFTMGLTLLASLAFGLGPALSSTRQALAVTLRNEGGSVIGGSHHGLRRTLSVAQVTLSLVLLVGAGLFLRTLNNLRTLGPGFPIERLVTFYVDTGQGGYDAERSKQFLQRLTDDLKTIPGVSNVGLASVRVLGGDTWDSSLTVEGYSGRPGAQPNMNAISPNYFATLGVPMVAGRDFTPDDRHTVDRKLGGQDSWTPTVIIVNETFVRRYFAGRNPVGRHVGFGGDPGTPMEMEVVGVARDMTYANVRDEIPPQAFVPYLAARGVVAMGVFLRTAGDPEQVLTTVRARLNALDPNLPMFSARTMESQLDTSLTNERMIASLCAVFGALAALLAIIGLYGVMSYNIARRTREIGIRMALGAVRRTVIAMVMREVLLLVAVGVLIGLAGALALGRLIETQLYGLKPHDAATLAVAAVGLALVALAAGYLPALRASRLDPTVALRQE
jgi:predicted permease